MSSDSDKKIPKDEIIESFVLSSGPGGQHVNKTASAVQLRFNVNDSKILSESVRDRLKKIARNRINANGDLIIIARRYKSQASNRKDAYQRLQNLVEKAMKPPKKRVPTKRTAASVEKRLRDKQARSEKKRRRERVIPPEDS